MNRLTGTSSYLYNVLKRNVPVQPRNLLLSVLALPLAPAAGLLELVAGGVGRGGTIAVLAQREADVRGRVP